MRLILALVCAAVTGCHASHALAECQRLQPMDGRFSGWYDGAQYDYEKAVARTLFGHELQQPRELQMLKLVPGELEEVVYVVNENYGDPFNPEYELVHVKASTWISSAVMKQGPSAIVPVKISRVKIDRKLFQHLIGVWRKMIFEARFPKTLKIPEGGSVYEFSADLHPYMGGSAYAQGPPPDECPGQLIALGMALGAYAQAPAKQRPALRQKLIRDADALLKRVERELSAN